MCDSSSSSEASEDAEERMKDEDEVNDRRLQELEELRSKYEDRTSTRILDFVVKVLGTVWTWENKSKAADNIWAHAVDEKAIAWCTSKCVPQSFRAEIDKYEVQNVATLCRAWACKMQHYYNRALLRVDPNSCIWEAIDHTWQPRGK